MQVYRMQVYQMEVYPMELFQLRYTEFSSYFTLRYSYACFQSTKLEDMGEFDWSSTVKSVILGSFYWCYVLSQVTFQ